MTLQKQISQRAATTTQHYSNQPTMAAVKDSIANNQMDIKVGLLEARQKTTMLPEELCSK